MGPRLRSAAIVAMIVTVGEIDVYAGDSSTASLEQSFTVQ
jgi:hypothetical protein